MRRTFGLGVDMADAKWIDGLSPDMSVAAAARRVIEVRLEVVSERLPDAVHQAIEDREYVHQLRVGTRRAGAAVRIFRECLSTKMSQALRRTLRKIRRAAGSARDWDVFQEMIAARMPRAEAKQSSGLDFLLGYGQGQRVLAQKDLLDLAPLADDNFASLTREALDSLEDNDAGEPFRAQAIPQLTELLRELDEAAAIDLRDYQNLHQVRILGKQLRYAMEIFASCFEPMFRDVIYPAVEEMQEILGLCNDSAVAVDRLQEMKAFLEKTQPKEWPRYRLGLEGLIRYHQRRLPEQRRHFAKWWEKWTSSGMEARLTTMLRP